MGVAEFEAFYASNRLGLLGLCFVYCLDGDAVTVALDRPSHRLATNWIAPFVWSD